MFYLNRDHKSLKTFYEKSNYIVNELFSLALSCSHTFVIEFDLDRLLNLVGYETLHKLLPNLQEHPKLSTKYTYEVYQGTLDQEKILLLRKMLSFKNNNWDDLPVNYINVIRLRDKNAVTTFRCNNLCSFILFNLPNKLLKTFKRTIEENDIPLDVIEQVNIDINKLKP